MIPQSKGKLFLADERGLNQLDWYRSYNTFNFGSYQHEHKVPFSDLYVLNDDTLASGKSICMCVEEHSAVILIPVVGAIEYMDNSGDIKLIEPGNVQLLDLPVGSRFQINNLYEEEMVNFLHLWVKTKKSNNQQEVAFDLLRNKNQLIEIFKLENAIGYLGQFDGRAEAVLPVSNPGNSLFAFVIDGEFEVQYRLMHARDGLVLWEINEAELEALSNNAVIMLLEIGKVNNHSGVLANH
ncbi:hypothetical protein JN11_01376 [Mucilaginibacter frigoritolerans]|uniref:Quercetin 2,3-dioxygenase C-terminal cupin domain-containing protein n=1 Tax=Mucilaginibacter frigoritolerans TaxID=652788 RepID=A0A562U9C3_9SPHI|nr:pirin family protein [Mucilaginibacter frigoritolerans]TWJ02404.1 hypothetical protein JN11_01376 [Mucilaginibacter frigoritolerans]